MMEKSNVGERYATEPDGFFRRKSELYSSFSFFLALIFRRLRRQFPAIFRGWLAGRESQFPRTRSHRLTHQRDGPLAATRWAPDPVMHVAA
jgi:hypothetical protein